MHQPQHDDAVVALQGGAVLQFGEHRLGVGFAAQLNNQAHAFAIGFVANAGYAVDLALVHLLDEQGMNLLKSETK